jgi:FAD/FMN-containing dehydrogenase
VTLIELPPHRAAGTACLDDLASRLGADRVALDEPSRLESSRDHAWLSPVLTAAIPDDAVADAVVRPRSAEELATVLAIAFEHGVAVTPRGKGTGNYGQAVPLAGGLVLDTAAVDGVIDVSDGWIDAYVGTSFTRLEAAARATGQELAMFPSTTGSMLGGFLSGGAGGTGSVENGMLWEGFVDGLTVLPCWDEPELIELDAARAAPYLHSYGTTGVMVAARVALRPARRWTALFASFPTLAAAAAAGERMLELETRPRNLSIDDAKLTELLGPHPAMPAGRVSLRAVISEPTVHFAGRAVAAEGGVVEGVLPQAVSLCVSLSYNHVTLRAKRALPDACHIQIGGRVVIEQHQEICAMLPDGMVHLDAMSIDGAVGYGGLHLSRFVDRRRLYEGMDDLRSRGARVVDPHTWALGGHGANDATVAVAVANDPQGLLNPGKLARPDTAAAA